MPRRAWRTSRSKHAARPNAAARARQLISRQHACKSAFASLLQVPLHCGLTGVVLSNPVGVVCWFGPSILAVDILSKNYSEHFRWPPRGGWSELGVAVCAEPPPSCGGTRSCTRRLAVMHWTTCADDVEIVNYQMEGGGHRFQSLQAASLLFIRRSRHVKARRRTYSRAQAPRQEPAGAYQPV